MTRRTHRDLLLRHCHTGSIDVESLPMQQPQTTIHRALNRASLQFCQGDTTRSTRCVIAREAPPCSIPLGRKPKFRCVEPVLANCRLSCHTVSCCFSMASGELLLHFLVPKQSLMFVSWWRIKHVSLHDFTCPMRPSTNRTFCLMSHISATRALFVSQGIFAYLYIFRTNCTNWYISAIQEVGQKCFARGIFLCTSCGWR